MKAIQLGKVQGFAPKPSQALTQGIEPTFDMVGFPAAFADRLMTVDGENRLVRIPEIAERVAAFVGARDAQPEVQTTRFTAVTYEIGDNLPGAAAQRHPHPALVGFLEDKRPQLIQFQHGTFDLASRPLIIAALRLQGPVALAVMAIVFLCAFVIVSVSHHVVAAVFWARMHYNRLYHEKVLPVNLVVCFGVPFPVNSTLCMSSQHIR
jgi:hypothetical protein